MTAARPADRLAAAVRDARAKRGVALVPFLTAGYPKRERFRAHLTAIAAAADVVEIGVPFSDPMADGVTIQRSSQAAIAQGVTLRWILAELADMTRKDALGGKPLVLMSYLNPLLQYGLAKLAAESVAAGVTGFIVPDLPIEEADDFRASLAPHGIALVQMVTPVTDDARLARLCAEAEGFIYAVTMTGVTGKSVSVPAQVTGYLDRVKQLAKAPVCAGFGIRSREQVKLLEGHVDGVVVGSALVEVLEREGDPAALLDALRAPSRV